MTAETVSAQLAEAASLMLVGMVVVFVFLALLIIAVNALSWLCSKLPQSEPQPQRPLTAVSPAPQTISHGVPPEHVAAITAAFALRQKRKNTK